MQVCVQPEHGRIVDGLLVQVYSRPERFVPMLRSGWGGLTLEEKHDYHRRHYTPVYLAEDALVLVGVDEIRRRVFEDRGL